MKSNWREILKPCCTSRSKVVAFVAIAFYFLIVQTATSRFHKLLTLQHLMRLRREQKILIQIALRNTRRARRVYAWAWPWNQFWVESLLQGDFVEDWWKENFRISRWTFELFQWLAQICERKTWNWIEVCLEKVVNETWNEKYDAFFYLTDCSHKKFDPLIPSMIERNTLSKTWQSYDPLTTGNEILPRHKWIYLSSRPWLPWTVTMPDHRVITTFTLVKFGGALTAHII